MQSHSKSTTPYSFIERIDMYEMNPETTTHMSDGIIEMYNIATVLLNSPPGSLSDWEENLLCTFIQMYWADEILTVNGEDG
jgi:hypothetical protein